MPVSVLHACVCCLTYFHLLWLQREKYISLYTQTLKSKSATKAQANALLEMEKNLEAADIILYRRIARMRMPKEKAKASSWSLSSWFGGKTASGEEEDGADLDAAKREYLSLLGAEEEFETPSDKAYTGIRVQSLMPTCTLILEEVTETESATLLEVTVAESALVFEIRPVTSAIKVDARVSDLLARIGAPGNTLHPILRSLATDQGTSNSNIFGVVFETKPIVEGPVSPDSRLSLSVAPTELDIFPAALKRLQAFFEVPANVDLSELATYYDATMAEVKTQARIGLEHMVANRTTLDIQMDIQAPVLILPTSFESRQANTPCVIVDFGALRLASDLLVPPAGDLHKSTVEELEALVYDNYQIQAVGMQVCVTYSCLASVLLVLPLA